MNYSLLPDEKLLQLLKASDQAAYKIIYERYWKNLFLKAYAKTYTKETAEEITQEIFASLWQNRERNNILQLENYLVTAVKYKVINYIHAKIQKEEKLRNMGWNESDSSTDTTIAVNELTRKLNEAIESLPDKTREVFTLSRMEKLPVKEIAQRLDLSEKAVEYHITRSLKLMRIYLKDFMIPCMVTLLLH